VAEAEVIPDFIARRVGRCIYCGTVPEPPGKLNDEHIVPYGLLPPGVPPWLLYDASCSKCADVTSAFERAVQKGPWAVVRQKLGLRSYRGRTTTLFTLDVLRDGRWETLRLPAADYPCVVNFLVFAPPGHLEGRQQKGIIIADVVPATYQWGPEPLATPAEIAKRLGVSDFKARVTFKKATFQRLLLKVAYSFTIGSLGAERLRDVYVLDAIMGRADDSGQWLGCDGQTTLPPIGFHMASVDVRGSDALCRVRLFPPPAPEYLVVVGRVK
jgi:hypothetical protein